MAEPERTRPVYMISVAAELAGMHPQTLRIYEQRGLIEPQRSPKGTRLFSQDDVERLRRIQELTNEMGMNLAGVEKVFELEGELAHLRKRMSRMERRAEQLRKEMHDEVERVRRSFRAEMVPYQPPEQALVPRGKGVRIQVQRPSR
jgi:MerR family transcriptional regulator/heat shock protein HspR